MGGMPFAVCGKDYGIGMSGYRFERLKILVVDDNPHMRSLVTAVLQAFGVTQIFEAADGQDALTKLRSTACDIAIVDWVMPGMSGLDLTKTIRNAPNSPNPFIPIIMLTGHTSLDHVEAARDAGVTEFLAKPVSAKGLMSRMQSVIEHPRPFVRTEVYFGPCRRRRRDNIYDGPERRADDPAAQAARA